MEESLQRWMLFRLRRDLLIRGGRASFVGSGCGDNSGEVNGCEAAGGCEAVLTRLCRRRKGRLERAGLRVEQMVLGRCVLPWFTVTDNSPDRYELLQ